MFGQGLTGHCGNAAIAARLVFENERHFKNIFSEIEAFVNISILFEGIFKEIEAFFN
jgi:hypothetical protein